MSDRCAPCAPANHISLQSCVSASEVTSGVLPAAVMIQLFSNGTCSGCLSTAPVLWQVLSDPRQKRFFKSKDMRDLFTLGDQYVDAPETAAIFAGLDSEVALDPAQLAAPAATEAAAAAGAEEEVANDRQGRSLHE